MRARGGFALLTALALLVMITVAALERTAIAKPRRLAMAGVVDHAVLGALAIGGVEHAREQLMQQTPLGPMQLRRTPANSFDRWSAAEGTVLTGSTGELRYRVELHDAGARLNINAATEDQMRKLLLALRVDARRADQVAQAFADWLDPDQLRRTNGAERSDYLRDGRMVLPDDGPFESVAMLRFVMGVDDSLDRLLRPYVTTFGSGRIDINAAARPVLLTIPGMTEEAVSLVLRYRQQGRSVTDLFRFADELSGGAREQLRAALPVLQKTVVLEPREMHVLSVATRPASSARVRVDAIISRDDEGRVVWRRVSP